ncbi:MAG: Fur family transcriptional regulator [Chloroflexota bacterium]
MPTTGRKITRALKQQGYRLTPQRRQLIKIITESHEHLTPAALYQKVCQKSPGLSLVTIYRTLEILTELGFICEVHAGGEHRSYLVRRPAEHHHHLVCTDCGAVLDFIGCDLAVLEERLSRKTGFKIDSHLLEFMGRCRSCQKKTSA